MQRRPIPGLKYYYANDKGEIISAHPKWRKKGFRKLVPGVGTNGYLRVHAGGKVWLAHRLVCFAFHGSPPGPNYECRHLNGNRFDNRPINLCWGTKRENFMDNVRHQKLKLCPESVKTIRYYLMFGHCRDHLARVYRVTRGQIGIIARGQQWKDEDAGYTQEFLDWIEMQKELAALGEGTRA